MYYLLFILFIFFYFFFLMCLDFVIAFIAIFFNYFNVLNTLIFMWAIIKAVYESYTIFYFDVMQFIIAMTLMICEKRKYLKSIFYNSCLLGDAKCFCHLYFFCSFHDFICFFITCTNWLLFHALSIISKFYFLIVLNINFKYKDRLKNYY